MGVHSDKTVRSWRFQRIQQRDLICVPGADSVVTLGTELLVALKAKVIPTVNLVVDTIVLSEHRAQVILRFWVNYFALLIDVRFDWAN